MTKTPEHASLKEVQKRIKQWDDEVVVCRTFRHDWQPLRVIHNKRLHFYTATLLCARCESVRVMEVSEKGRVFSTWIVYSEGYLATGAGRIAGEGKDAVRLAALTRTFAMTTISGVKAEEATPRSTSARKALANGAS